MALSICLSVRLSCFGDRQRGICLSFREDGLMRWRCPSVCLSCLGDRQRGICLFFSGGDLMRWCCPSVCLSVCPVSVIGSEVFDCNSAKAA